jgi:hypothetical protein
MRRVKFYFFVARDFGTAFIITQIFVLSMSGVVYSLDKHRCVLLGYFGLSKYPMLFYYGCGLVVFLAAVGLLSLCGFANEYSRGTSCHRCCQDCCNCCCVDMFGNPYVPIYCPTDCRLCCLDCAGCSNCAACNCELSACNCCEAGACSSIGAELLPVLLIAVVVFALIGAIVAVVAGTVFLQGVVQT